MANSGLDADSLIALGASALAAVCLAMALRNCSNRRIAVGLMWSLASAAFGFVAYFFVAFTFRMF